MDKFPICWNGNACGELAVKNEALYTCFHARCSLPGEGLWCIWVVGEHGELRLGILEPLGDTAEISRRFSDRMTQHAGRFLRGEIRPVAIENGKGKWTAISEISQKVLWIQKIEKREGVLVCLERDGYCLAVPYTKEQPFPLTALFCFAKIRCIAGKYYAVFAFDQKDRPVFQIGNRYEMEKTGE